MRTTRNRMMSILLMGSILTSLSAWSQMTGRHSTSNAGRTVSTSQQAGTRQVSSPKVNSASSSVGSSRTTQQQSVGVHSGSRSVSTANQPAVRQSNTSSSSSLQNSSRTTQHSTVNSSSLNNRYNGGTATTRSTSQSTSRSSSSTGSISTSRSATGTSATVNRGNTSTMNNNAITDGTRGRTFSTGNDVRPSSGSTTTGNRGYVTPGTGNSRSTNEGTVVSRGGTGVSTVTTTDNSNNNRPGSNDHNGNGNNGNNHNGGNNGVVNSRNTADRQPYGGYNNQRDFDHHNNVIHDNFNRGHWTTHVAPPPRPYRPLRVHVWRPVRPIGWRPITGIPIIDGILGLTFGMYYDASLSYLYSNGYYIDGFDNSVVYLRDVTEMDYFWPDVMLQYDDYQRLTYAQFIYSTSYPDRLRLRDLYSRLCYIYGPPVTFRDDAISQISWYGGDQKGYITLRYSRNNGRYYTTLSYGY